jgi:drug/metabolite transporter superfamily protein YnfA
MDRVWSVVFWIADLCEIRSDDPAVASIKRARLWVVLLLAATPTCIAIAFSLQPDLPASEKPNVLVVSSKVQQLVATGFMIAALTCILGAMWNMWVWYRAYTKPENYY